MEETRQNAPEDITTEMLEKEETDGDICLHLKHARKIMTFFDKIGIQAYQKLIPTASVLEMFGNEINKYWQKNSYYKIVEFDRNKDIYKDFFPWAGFEYLASKSGLNLKSDNNLNYVGRKGNKQEAYVLGLYVIGIGLLLAVGTFLMNILFGGCSR